MENEHTLDTNESLQLIDEMVQRARFNFSQGSFYFILWGVILFLAAMYEFFFSGQYSWVGWPLAGLLGGIGSMVYGALQSKQRKRMHLDRVYTWIWVVFFITLILLLVGWVSSGTNPNGYILILAGFPTLLTGIILQFNPLKYGGIGFWVLGMLALFIWPQYSTIIYALGMIQGYLIPGLLMRNIKNHV